MKDNPDPPLDLIVSENAVISHWSSEPVGNIPPELAYLNFRTAYIGLIGQGDQEKMVRLYFPKNPREGIKVHDPKTNSRITAEQEVLRLVRIFEQELLYGDNVNVDVPLIDTDGKILYPDAAQAEAEERRFLAESIEFTRAKYAKEANRFQIRRVQGPRPRGIQVTRIERDYLTGQLERFA